MRIDKRLNLVVPVPRDGGGVIYAHAMPISREVFEANFEVMARAYAKLWANGPRETMMTAPRVALLQIKKAAEELRLTEQTDALLAEIRRLTNVIAPSGSGWSSTPLHVAVQQKTIGDDELFDVENVVAFFTLASAMNRRHEAADVLAGMNALWGTSTVPSTCTEYAASLTTSTVDATTAPAASSVPT